MLDSILKKAKRFLNNIPTELWTVLLIVPTIFALSRTDFYKSIELRSYDFRFNTKRDIDISPDILMLDIDDESLDYVGRWPWPRYQIAKGLKTLQEFRPKQIIFDVEFTEKSQILYREDKAEVEFGSFLQKTQTYIQENTNLEDPELQNQFLNYQVSNLNQALTEAIVDNDFEFAKQIQALGNVYLTARGDQQTLDIQTQKNQEEWYDLIYSKENPIDPLMIQKKPSDLNSYISYEMLYVPVSPLHKWARGFGFTNVNLDEDHILRRVPLFIEHKGNFIPELSMRPFLDYIGIKNLDQIDFSKKNRILLKNAQFPKGDSIETVDVEIPVNEKGELIVNWVNRKWGKGFLHYNWARIIEYQDLKENLQLNQANLQLLAEAPNSIEALQLTEYLLQLAEGGEEEEGEVEKTTLEPGGNGTVDASYSPQEKAIQFMQSSIIAPTQERIDFLREEIRDSVTGKICFIGLTATATSDIGSIPVDSSSPFVSARSNVYNTLLQRDFIHEIPDYWNWILVVLINISFALVARYLKPLWIPIVGLLIMSIYYGSTILILSQGWVWELMSVELTLVISIASISTIKFLSSDKEKKFIKNAFGQYLSPDIITQLIDDPTRLSLGGEKKIITAFFSDVAGFSTISENLSPEELVSLLNIYLTEMCNVISKYNGTIDKFEGDAIIAFWGAPIDNPNHAKDSCFASIEMQQLLLELRQKWTAEGRGELITQMKMRIGLNSGPAVVGNMGSQNRMDYTMMGDSVNLAARLEGANKFYGTYSMISQSTYDLAKDVIEARELDLIRVVGKKEPITVYQLLSKKGELTSQTTQVLEAYQKALVTYKERDWKEAISLFQKTLEIDPSDQPVQNYIDRCQHYLDEPPKAEWDGVFVLTSKG